MAPWLIFCLITLRKIVYCGFNHWNYENVITTNRDPTICDYKYMKMAVMALLFYVWADNARLFILDVRLAVKLHSIFSKLLFPLNSSNAWQMESFQPGPIDTSVLSEQDNHVSTSIWNGKEPGVYRCIPANPKSGCWKLNDRQCDIVKRSGLHHLSQICHMWIDHAPISALIERWRP